MIPFMWASRGAVLPSWAWWSFRLASLLVVAGAFVLCACGVCRADVYWGNYLSFAGEGTSYIGHARLDGSEANAQFLNIKAEKPVGLAADGSFIYVAFPGPKGGTIGRANLQGGEPEPHFIYGPGGTALEGVSGIAVGSQYVYWTNGLVGPKGPRPRSGGRRSPVVRGNPDFITLPSVSDGQSLAINGDHLYWNAGPRSAGPTSTVAKSNRNSSRANRANLSASSSGSRPTPNTSTSRTTKPQARRPA